MRVLICGDRRWGFPEGDPEADEQRRILLAFIMSLPKDTVVIEGGALGADRLAARYAAAAGLEVLTFPADWQRYGRAAGPIRNKQMLIDGRPDFVAAFHDDIENSKGTKNMLSQADKAAVHCTVFKRKTEQSKPKA